MHGDYEEGEIDGAVKVKVKEEQEEEEEDDDEGSLSSQPGDDSKPSKRRPAAKAKPKAKATLKATAKPKSFGSKSEPKFVKPRPSAPPMKQSGPSTTYYMSAKVTVSHAKQGFRVFLDLTQKNPVDKLVPWATHGGYQKAWLHAMRMCEGRD